MCEEFSNWSWKLRAAELGRKEHDAENAAKKEGTPVTPTVAGPAREIRRAARIGSGLTQ